MFIGISCTSSNKKNLSMLHGAIVRGDSTQNKLTLVFTGDIFADGTEHIRKVLKKHEIKGAFFFTGNYYRNPDFEKSILDLIEDGHYLGAHSDRHLLYCDWENRDSLLVSNSEFLTDLEANYKEMRRFGISKDQVPYYLPPYEWYNKTIAEWTSNTGLQLINMTHGTLSHADYTSPEMLNYRTSKEIFSNILNFERKNTSGLNGFLLLMHIGTDPKRKDKFYYHLEDLILELKSRKYKITGIHELLASG
ncbi:MAG: polysaccharide deacetylase family protein [Maribacter sp.]|nr:polysaccharide deacetylase family protein [Maribacter sp.]NNK18867.1 polysaccharide deacetylase family protein [Maribacter sp.]NNK76254.1 polysaccharide deacetylase family protein [Maribacter sp.]